jgi:hypothetical protein
VQRARIQKVAFVTSKGPLHIPEACPEFGNIYLNICGVDVLATVDWGAEITVCSDHTWSVITQACPQQTLSSHLTFHGVRKGLKIELADGFVVSDWTVRVYSVEAKYTPLKKIGLLVYVVSHERVQIEGIILGRNTLTFNGMGVRYRNPTHFNPVGIPYLNVAGHSHAHGLILLLLKK